MAPPIPPILPRLEALTDDLLENIFLRIASPADLARASAACVSFRRLIADPSFLRRYRPAHPPLLLGFLCHGFHPAEPPHPKAPAGRALAHATGFTFDYLPGGRWHHSDVRDGRVLLEGKPAGGKDGVLLPDLAVCDPRRYLLLPPIPDDLVASVQVQEHMIYFFEAFLVPSGHDEEDETSFGVIARTHCAEKWVIFIFSSGSGRWSVGASTSWDDLGLNTLPGIILSWPHYDYGCFYWKMNGRNKLLKLDINRMEFSTVDLPPGYNERKYFIMEAGEGRLAMFSHARRGLSVLLHHYAK